MGEGRTPSQTVGPFLSIGLTWPKGRFVVPADTPGAVRITGVLRDGDGEPVTDGLVETWQADPDGRFAHPDAGPRRGAPGSRGSPASAAARPTPARAPSRSSR